MISSWLSLSISCQELDNLNRIFNIGWLWVDESLNNYPQRMVKTLLHKVLDRLLAQEVDWHWENTKTVLEHPSVVDWLVVRANDTFCRRVAKPGHNLDDLGKLSYYSISLLGHGPPIELLVLGDGFHDLWDEELNRQSWVGQLLVSEE